MIQLLLASVLPLFSQNTTECFGALAVPIFAPLADGAALFGLVVASQTRFVDLRWDGRLIEAASMACVELPPREARALRTLLRVASGKLGEAKAGIAAPNGATAVVGLPGRPLARY
jgi:hypothetical protein